MEQRLCTLRARRRRRRRRHAATRHAEPLVMALVRRRRLR